MELLGPMGCDGDIGGDGLKNVQSIQTSDDAFAAILADGSVFAWGGHGGGQCEHVKEQLQNVKLVQANARAFAAIKEDGSVVTWGQSAFGGDSSLATCSGCRACSCIFFW